MLMNSLQRSALGAALASLLFLSSSAHAANIIVVSADGPNEGLNDSSPRTPVGGNTGVTLGEQRRQALERAASIWGGLLNSSVDIVIEVNFGPLTCGPQGVVLGNAGPHSVLASFTNAPLPNTLYPVALANARAGIDHNGGSPELESNFNTRVDDGCVPGLSFYYGLDSSPPANGIDVVTIALHEFAHGLGIASFVDSNTGALFMGTDDGYSANLEDHSLGLGWLSMNNGQRQNSAVDTNDLHWVGPEVVAASGGLAAGRHPSGHVEVFAPNPVNLGSSVSHLSDRLSPDQLMEPFFSGATQDPGLAFEMLLDLGWERLVVGVCGNGTIESGEQCDDGNLVDGDCCSATCQFEPNGGACGDGSSSDCDGPDTCNNGQCSQNRRPQGFVCRASNSLCDEAEVCDGQSSLCPPDGPSPAGAVCRPAVGDCDVAEVCNGMSTSCPADGRAQAGTLCRPAQSVCDVSEVCDGQSTACPANVFAPAGIECRAAAGTCDVAEACTGSSGLCPPNAFQTGSVCRPAAGVCDVVDRCDGAGPSCPADQRRSPNFVCRPSVGPCDPADRCSPASVDCPLDLIARDGAPCDDGLICNGQSTCQSGECQDGPVPVCTSNSICEIGRCVEPAGCQFEQVPNCCVRNADCDDGNACTREVCDTARNQCIVNPVPDCCLSNAQCEDGDPCTIDQCAANRCVQRPNPQCRGDGGVDLGVDGGTDVGRDSGPVVSADAQVIDGSSGPDGSVGPPPRLLETAEPVGCGCHAESQDAPRNAPGGLWALMFLGLLGFASRRR